MACTRSGVRAPSAPYPGTSSTSTTVGAEEFGYRYARFLQRAAGGEEFLVTRRGRPMARISPPELPGQQELAPVDDA